MYNLKNSIKYKQNNYVHNVASKSISDSVPSIFLTTKKTPITHSRNYVATKKNKKQHTVTEDST